MYHLTKHRGEGNNCLRFAVFPDRDANFVESKHQFGYTALMYLDTRSWTGECSVQYILQYPSRMPFRRIKAQVVENSGPAVKVSRLDLKNKAVRGVAR
jgi:hypothetical protein